MSLRFDASLRDISFFVAVFEERSFTRAAEREAATQSGVSQHIKKLEERFGVALFVRHAGTVSPTPAAETYYRQCIELLRRYETANRHVREFGDELSGEVSVGLMATVTRSALAPTLIKFTAKHPNVKVSVIETHSRLLAQQVDAGELDFAIVPALLEQRGLKSTFFLRTPEVLVSAKNSGNRHLEPVQLAAIEPLKLILPSRHNIRRQALEHYFTSADVKVSRQMDLDVIFTTLDIVEHTDWRAILPAIMMAAEVTHPRLTLNPIVDPALWFDLHCIEPLRRPLSRVANAFYVALQREAGALNKSAIRSFKQTRLKML